MASAGNGKLALSLSHCGRHLSYDIHRPASEVVKPLMPKNELIKDSKGACIPLRVTKRAGKKLISPRLLMKCGCCDQSLEIYFDERQTGNPHHDSLEINGVNGTVDQWRQVLLPFLKTRR